MNGGIIEPHEAEGAEFEALIARSTPLGLGVAQRKIGEELKRRSDGGGVQFHTRIMPSAWYGTLDAGIRFPVRVLHASGDVETCQSCQGGEGHDYDRPSIDLCAGGGIDGTGIRAASALSAYGIEVRDVALLYTFSHGLPTDRVWRITLRRAWPERADEEINFVYGYTVMGKGP